MNIKDFNKYLIYEEVNNNIYLSNKNIESDDDNITNSGKLRDYIKNNVLWDGGIDFDFDKNKIFSCFNPCSNAYNTDMNDKLVKELMKIIIEQMLTTLPDVLGSDELFHLSSFVYKISNKYAPKIMTKIVIKNLQEYL